MANGVCTLFNHVIVGLKGKQLQKSLTPLGQASQKIEKFEDGSVWASERAISLMLAAQHKPCKQGTT